MTQPTQNSDPSLRHPQIILHQQSAYACLLWGIWEHKMVPDYLLQKSFMHEDEAHFQK